jgi:hypothetical protein
MIVFVKHQIPIPRSAMDAVMNCQTGAAHLFLENIYSMLTNQKLPDCSTEVITVDDLVEHYALPTTSSVIRQMSGCALKSKIIFEAHRKLTKSNQSVIGTNIPQLAK